MKHSLKRDARRTFTITVPPEMIVDGKIGLVVIGNRVAYAATHGMTTSFTEFWNSSVRVF